MSIGLERVHAISYRQWDNYLIDKYWITLRKKTLSIYVQIYLFIWKTLKNWHRIPCFTSVQNKHFETIDFVFISFNLKTIVVVIVDNSGLRSIPKFVRLNSLPVKIQLIICEYSSKLAEETLAARQLVYLTNFWVIHTNLL